MSEENNSDLGDWMRGLYAALPNGETAVITRLNPPGVFEIRGVVLHHTCWSRLGVYPLKPKTEPMKVTLVEADRPC
jgi:hypothetical protein